MNTNFNLFIDGGIIVVYLVLLTAIGVYFSRKQRTLSDFIKGGKIGFLAMGASLMAALNSGIDYIQIPAWGYRFGMLAAVFVFTWIFIFPWITNVIMPFYRRLDVFSPYEYLEQRFSLAVRLLASSIYVLWRCGWMGAAIYVPCLSINAATGGALPVTTLVVVLGIVVTVYTVLGGLRAVFWTDVAQFFIMFAGLAATVWFIFSEIPGGITAFWHTNLEAGKFSIVGRIPGWEEADFAQKVRMYFFTSEVTFIGVMCGVGFNRLAQYTGDQVAVQRYQSTRSTREARQAMVVNLVCDIVWGVALAAIGLALFTFYQAQGGYPADQNADKILSHFMSTQFPVGLTGVVIAAVLAASLSSVDSALNATTSIVVVDFYGRLVKGRRTPGQSADPAEQRSEVRLSRIVNVALGALLVGFGANMYRFGELWQGVNRVLGAFGGPLFGIFVLGMFMRRSHATGVMVGGLVGMTYNVYVALIVRQLSFQWTYPLGVFVTIAVGYLASLLLPNPRAGEEPLTWRNVMRLPERARAEVAHG